MVAPVSVVVSMFAIFLNYWRDFQFPNFFDFSTNGEMRYNAKHTHF